jgi:DNA polymerase-3 subunit gamma/tau
MVNYLLSEDQSAALLLFDEILSNGFEAQHFISGLAKHFRNLLVAQNPSTVRLMEASDSIKQQYSAQAQNVDKTLLLRALELSNECDFNYKTSNNKRLSVELCLMKINANYVFMKNRAAAATKVRQSRE